MKHQLSLTTLRAAMDTESLGTPDAYTIAEKQAYHFLKLTDCTKPTHISDAIAGLPRFRVDIVDNLPTSGASEWHNGHWQILINGNEPPTRQRFTLAHELKHILDHPYVSETSPSKAEQEHQESVCDYFAGCLLVPTPWLKHMWKSGMHSTPKLAGFFGVSRQAIAVRLNQTNLRSSSHGLTATESLKRAFNSVRNKPYRRPVRYRRTPKQPAPTYLRHANPFLPLRTKGLPAR